MIMKVVEYFLMDQDFLAVNEWESSLFNIIQHCMCLMRTDLRMYISSRLVS